MRRPPNRAETRRSHCGIFLWIFVLVSAALCVCAQPVITSQPSNQTASPFGDVTFRVTAQGAAPLTFQWRFNNPDLLDKTNSILTLTNIERSDAGEFSVVARNSSGAVTSRVATLSITSFQSAHFFGYSWTSAHTGEWEPSTSYWNGRPANGPLWSELISTNLGLPYLEANNHAAAGAGAADVRRQSHTFVLPTKPQLSVYFLMFADDILRAFPGDPAYVAATNETTWRKIINEGIVNNSNAVSELYDRGARAIVIQSEIDLSAAPRAFRDFGTNSAARAKVSEYSTAYNTGFRSAIDSFMQAKTDLRIIWVDLFSKLQDVQTRSAQYGFTKTTIDALNDPALSDKSFAGPGADYLFWNPLHATTKFHELIRGWTLEALTNSVLETLEASQSNSLPIIRMNRLQIGRDYTLQTSTELGTWIDLQQFTAVAGTNQWTSTDPAPRAVFYRLKWAR